jgi:hypothetical protein
LGEEHNSSEAMTEEELKKRINAVLVSDLSDHEIIRKLVPIIKEFGNQRYKEGYDDGYDGVPYENTTIAVP